MVLPLRELEYRKRNTSEGLSNITVSLPIWHKLGNVIPRVLTLLGKKCMWYWILKEDLKQIVDYIGGLLSTAIGPLMMQFGITKMEKQTFCSDFRCKARALPLWAGSGFSNWLSCLNHTSSAFLWFSISGALKWRQSDLGGSSLVLQVGCYLTLIDPRGTFIVLCLHQSFQNIELFFIHVILFLCHYFLYWRDNELYDCGNKISRHNRAWEQSPMHLCRHGRRARELEWSVGERASVFLPRMLVNLEMYVSGYWLSFYYGVYFVCAYAYKTSNFRHQFEMVVPYFSGLHSKFLIMFRAVTKRNCRL